MAIRRFSKDQQLYKRAKELESTTHDLFARISKLDKAVMVSQHNKLAKQILESLKTYSALGLRPWECVTILEDITQDVIRKWEVYYEGDRVEREE